MDPIQKPLFLTKYLAIPVEQKHYEMRCLFCGRSIMAKIQHNSHCECGAVYRWVTGTWYHPGRRKK